MNEAAKEAAKLLKRTLRLPTSKFPPRPAPTDIANYLPRCTDDLYAWQSQQENRSSKHIFTLHDGPPYANGDLHVGHALNKIVKDIISRSKLQEGWRINYIPGWDCHGLPIELKALEKQGWKRGKDVDPVMIRKTARKFAFDALKRQMKDYRSWGIMADWDNHWKTMDKDFELRQLAVFKAMAQHGLIYRRYKPVYWSPSSGTALAEAEVDYKNDYVSTAALVKFPLHGKVGGSDLVHAVVWTTTPWTIPANQAIAINSEIEYIIAESKVHGKLVIAAPRLEYVEEQIGEKLTVFGSISADELTACSYSGLPVFGEDVQNRPIIHADFVKDDSGTGLVHCAPGHGKEDFEALQPLIRNGRVQVRAPVDDHGKYTSIASAADPSILAGLYVYEEGNQKVLELLANHQLLMSSYKFRHKYTIDWRTKEPVMIRATAQWFADVSSIKDDALSSLDQVCFKPDTGSSRLRSFVETRSEWCISRQRAWGVPIPAIYHKETNEAVLTPESIDHIIRTINERGIDAWWADAPDEPAWIPAGLSAADYIRGTDTMDVWFDSGTSWKIMDTPGTPEAVADVYLEGSDQHRGWFQSSLLTKIAHHKATNNTTPAQAPFRTLATHGFTLDANGKKMSKSEGNVIAPSEIIAGLGKSTQVQASKKGRQIHSHGPDVLRLWAASTDWTRDFVISEKVVSTVHTNLDKYRVTFKMLLGMLQDFDVKLSVKYEEMGQLDQIALLQLYEVSNTVRQAFVDIEFHKAINAINKWIASDLSGFYFEAVKDIIYCDTPTNPRRLSAQTTLCHIFSQFQHMLAPITPLLIEETFAHSSKSFADSPLKRLWDSLPIEWNNTDLTQQLPTLMSINSSVKIAQERARAAKLMGQSLASEVVLWLKPDMDLTISDTTLKEIFVTSGVSRIYHMDVISTTLGILQQDEPDRMDTRLQIATLFKSTEDDAWAECQEIQGPQGELLGVAIVQKPKLDKCARCWKFEVPQHASEENTLPLCERCESAVHDFEKSQLTE